MKNLCWRFSLLSIDMNKVYFAGGVANIDWIKNFLEIFLCWFYQEWRHCVRPSGLLRMSSPMVNTNNIFLIRKNINVWHRSFRWTSQNNTQKEKHIFYEVFIKISTFKLSPLLTDWPRFTPNRAHKSYLTSKKPKLKKFFLFITQGFFFSNRKLNDSFAKNFWFQSYCSHPWNVVPTCQRCWAFRWVPRSKTAFIIATLGIT